MTKWIAYSFIHSLCLFFYAVITNVNEFCAGDNNKWAIISITWNTLFLHIEREKDTCKQKSAESCQMTKSQWNCLAKFETVFCDNRFSTAFCSSKVVSNCQTVKQKINNNQIMRKFLRNFSIRKNTHRLLSTSYTTTQWEIIHCKINSEVLFLLLTLFTP